MEEKFLQTNEKEYFYNLDLFKFVFSILIVTLHLFTVYYTGKSLEGLYICVEFFFLLNGFFLARSIKNLAPKDISIRENLSKRVKKIYPLYLLAFILTFFAGLYIFYPSQIPEIFMLQTAPPLINVSAWYITSYLIGTTCFLGLYKLLDSKKKLFNISFPLSIFTICYFILAFKTLDIWPKNIFGIFNTGLLRGFAEISLGFWLFEFVDKYKDIFNKFLSYYAITPIFEATIIVLTFKFMFNSRLPLPFLFLQVLLFMGLITLFYLKKGFFSQRLNNKNFKILGELSLPIYLGHYAFITYLNFHLLHSTALTKIVFVYTGTFSFALIYVLLANALSRFSKRITQADGVG